MRGSSSHAAGVDPDELEKFREVAEQWWDTEGPMRPLHQLSPCRLAWIRQQVCRHFGRDAARRDPLAGLEVLDVGCGGGLLAEPLTRLGACVTGLDPVPENVAAAARHAAELDLTIDYLLGTTDILVAQHRTFPLVIALEVIEHTPDPRAFVGDLARLTAPGGLIILSTLSRTWRGWLLGIIGAEHVLGWLPRGTHDWQRFLTPAELAGMLREHGIRPTDLTGIGYDIGNDQFRLGRDTSVNYMLAAARD